MAFHKLKYELGEKKGKFKLKTHETKHFTEQHNVQYLIYKHTQ